MYRSDQLADRLRVVQGSLAASGDPDELHTSYACESIRWAVGSCRVSGEILCWLVGLSDSGFRDLIRALAGPEHRMDRTPQWLNRVYFGTLD